MKHVINIKSGKGSINLVSGNYSIESNVIGYSIVNPSNISISDEVSYDVKVNGSGRLVIHVSDGTSDIEKCRFIRTDKDGAFYGSYVETDSSGNAILDNLPYSKDRDVSIYVRQVMSDSLHKFNDEAIEVVMDRENTTLEVVNSLISNNMLIDKESSSLYIE